MVLPEQCKKYDRTLVRFGMVAESAALQQNMEESLRSGKLAQPQMTTTRKVKFILRWAVAIIVDLVALYYTHNALISVILAAVAFVLTKAVLGLWTTPIDELYDAMRSGKPEQIKWATALCSAADNGDKEGMKAATDALAKAIRENKLSGYGKRRQRYSHRRAEQKGPLIRKMRFDFARMVQYVRGGNRKLIL